MKKLLSSDYINNNLLEGEKVICYGKTHRIIFLPSVLTFFISMILFIVYIKATIIIGTLLLIYSLGTALQSFIYFISTEFAITNKRIISKIGLISVNTIELNFNKIESLQVEQSIIGRILNYGNLKLRGTGGSISTILMIENPMNFRKKSLELINKN
jgi:uncharacterized membrane protein YdbT with pleckstrin-like domain